jgi:hypothetical protein
MAIRVWIKAVLTAIGVGALAGAAQLGVAYGLGIVRLDRSFDTATGNLWNAQLAWVSWFAALAAIAGATAGAAVTRRHSFPSPGIGARIVLALFGGIGAGAVVPLTLRPARAAELTQSMDPALVVALAAGLGAVVGILVAVAVLSLRPLAWHVATVSAVLWLAALVPAAHGLGTDGPGPALRLGVPQWTAHATDGNRLLASLTMPALALLAGAILAALARVRREPAVSAAATGAAGAAPLALAYLIAGPGLNSDLTDQMAPYLGALIAVPAGLLGSLLLTLLIRRAEPGAATRADDSGHVGAAPGTARGRAGVATVAGNAAARGGAGSAGGPSGEGAAGWAGAFGGGASGGPASERGTVPSGSADATPRAGSGQGPMTGADATWPVRGGASGSGSGSEPLEPTHIIPPVTVPEPRPEAAPQRASGTARVPRRDIPVQDEGYMEWVSNLGSDDPSAPRPAEGDPLPRRTPGQRFPAGA